MIDKPIASVIIPTYNYGQYITEAINSVINQNYCKDQIEIIVVDDGSADNTREVLQSFINANEIQYFYQQNKGKAAATALAIEKSKGTYIFNLDADDYFLPNKISETVKILEANNDIIHVASPAKIYFEKEKKWGVENPPKDILQKPMDGRLLLKQFYYNNILFGGGSTYAARSSILKSILIPDEVDMYIDEFLLISILPYGKSFFLEKPLSVWRVHSSNYSGQTSTKDETLKKGGRLLSSSSAILNYLINKRYDADLIKIYKVRDATRRIAFKESCNNKSLADIWKYANEILRLKPTWKIIKNYAVINRLIPSFLFRFLKKFKTIQHVKQFYQ